MTVTATIFPSHNDGSYRAEPLASDDGYTFWVSVKDSVNPYLSVCSIHTRSFEHARHIADAMNWRPEAQVAEAAE